MSVGEFFHMNGYAFYVWGSYGVTLLVLLIEIAMVRHRKQLVLRQLRMMNESGDE
jgi:heme exporter protein D